MYRNLVLAVCFVAGLLVADRVVAQPLGGPKSDCDSIAPYSTITYTITVYADYVTDIRLSGDGRTDLDVHVYNERGEELACGVSDIDEEYIRLRPGSRYPGEQTRTLTVVVSNLGPVWNRYCIYFW